MLRCVSADSSARAGVASCDWQGWRSWNLSQHAWSACIDCSSLLGAGEGPGMVLGGRSATLSSCQCGPGSPLRLTMMQLLGNQLPVMLRP